MSLSTSDFAFVYSGGISNANPDLSLGGTMSVQPILGVRLFTDVTTSQAVSGLVDYRCVYINNTNNLYTLYDANILVSYTVPGDVTVQLGFKFINERQDITVTNATDITGGDFVIVYTDVQGNNYTLSIPWSNNLSTWANNLQTAIRTVPNLTGVVVSGITSGSNVIFEIDFYGDAAYRCHNLMLLQSNSLTSSGPAIMVNIVKVINGSPINSIADQIDVSTTAPTNIVFSDFAVPGNMRPQDFVPVWIQRTVPINSTAIENDGFTLSVIGNAIAP